MKEDKGKTPLRIILHNFLNHIEKLEAHRSAEDSYEKEFQDLKHFSETLKGLKQYASGEGEKEVNRKKNRYKDILPFDFSRVVLSEYAGTPGSDYINANYIKGASGSPAYIASQGPLPHTVNDFWRMVVECEVHVIIMACNQDEAGKHKCENYWVEREGEVKQFGMVKIRLIQASPVCPDFSVRTMRLQYTNRESNPEERTVCQFHYSAWPDHGVPASVRPLVDMVRLVRDTQASETLPVLVHCSAGCGRTGTICAIDYVWGLLRAGKLTKDFSLLALVREMRRQRVAMVQTTEQYVLVHRAVRELFHEQLRVIDSHPYENIDLNGSLRTSPELENGCATENNVEEKSNEAPPLPRKKRPHIASSKYEKEVENHSQKERNSQSKQSSPGRPRIAKLKAMFERNPIARSHSLGRQAAENSMQVTKTPPVLPIKRSKSLRILGYGERSKLSIAPSTEVDSETKTKASSPKSSPSSDKSARQVRRRRSFEWNGSGQPVRRSLDLEATQGPEKVLGAVSIRERRDSFRQAVSQDAAEARRERERIAAELRARLSNPPARPMTPRRGPAKPPPPPPPPNPNVIVVKADRSSPKSVDLYVKSLAFVPRSYHSLEREVPATPSSSKTPLKKTNSSDNDLYARIGQMRRALTSLDLKTSKNLQLPDPCKLRQTPNRNSVKVYESLEKMIRGDIEVRRAAATPSSSNSPQKDFYSSPRGGPSPQTGSNPQSDEYSSPRGNPSPQTELYSSPRGGPSPQTELYASPRRGPSPQADLYASPRRGPSPQTELYSSSRGGPSPQTCSSKGVAPDRNDRTPAMYKESDGTSYGLAAGVSIRRGAQDDLALCAGIPLPPGPAAPPRVKRHASVVLLRHNVAPGVAEHSRGPATTPRRSEPKTTNYLKGPFNIDVDEIADNMRKYSAASPRTPAAGHNPRPSAPILVMRPPNPSNPVVPLPQGFQSEGHRLRKTPPTQPQPQPQPQPRPHSHQAMTSNQFLPTQHKHQLPQQRYMSPQPNQQQQQRLLSQQTSPRPSGPHMHLHPQWQQLKPPKQLYVQQGRPKGPPRQTRPTHVHPPPYAPSPAHPHSGGHLTHPLRGAPSQSFSSPFYQSAAQLGEEPVKTPVKKQQYL